MAEKIESTLISANNEELSIQEDASKNERCLSTASSESGAGGCGGL